MPSEGEGRPVVEQNKPASSGSPRPFDAHTVEYLVKLMSEHDLSEVHLEEGEQVIRLRRGIRHASGNPAALSGLNPGLLPAVHPGAAANLVPSPQPAPAQTGKKLVEIKSPTPGTFYRASGPESEPFTQVGAKVRADTIVCIIEAMKVFNEIPAEVAGTIVAIKVQDKEPVEYGQVLFLVEPD
jgi:acetyl-CoA carboxylase biotin carboxyl carrier protein